MSANSLVERYELQDKLGEGGMGAVFAAVQRATGRRVAVKLVNAEHAKNKEHVARFQVEARAAGAVESQHIAQVLDAGVDGDEAPFLVMELLRGEDVQRLFKRAGAVDPDLALRIVAQACLGLEKAHREKILHRDIKPANLFLAEVDDDHILVKILDFGIAKMRPEEELTTDAPLTRTGALLGTPLYMSPEQARNKKNAVDARSDVWSMGIVLFQALVGRVPLHDADSLGDVLYRICSEPTPRVQPLAPHVPAGVAAIVERATTLDPSARFPSARAMYDAIVPLLKNGTAIHARDLTTPAARAATNAPASVTTGAEAFSGATAAASSQAVPSTTLSPSRRPPTLFIGAAAVAAAIAITAFAMRSRTDLAVPASASDLPATAPPATATPAIVPATPASIVAPPPSAPLVATAEPSASAVASSAPRTKGSATQRLTTNATATPHATSSPTTPPTPTPPATSNPFGGSRQ